MAQTRLNELQTILDQEWVQDMKKMEDMKTFFGYMQLSVEDGGDKIRNNAEEWQTIEDSCDPLLNVSQYRITDISLVETRRPVRVAYQRFIQLDGVKETKPPEDDLAVNFREGLDK